MGQHSAFVFSVQRRVEAVEALSFDPRSLHAALSIYLCMYVCMYVCM